MRHVGGWFQDSKISGGRGGSEHLTASTLKSGLWCGCGFGTRLVLPREVVPWGCGFGTRLVFALRAGYGVVVPDWRTRVLAGWGWGGTEWGRGCS